MKKLSDQFEIAKQITLADEGGWMIRWSCFVRGEWIYPTISLLKALYDGWEIRIDTQYDELIAAHKEGKVIQVKSASGWRDVHGSLFKLPVVEYRIKPDEKWAKEKEAFARGEIIQYRDKIRQPEWTNLPSHLDPAWFKGEGHEYRIKPDEYAELKKAREEGRVIELWSEMGGWRAVDPIWASPVSDYRIKKEEDQYRPLNSDDIDVMSEFRLIASQKICSPIARSNEGITVASGRVITFYLWKELRDKFEFRSSKNEAWGKCEKLAN